MRVISGSARGRKLVSADGTDTRPTTDRVKESMFNLIAPHIPGARVLDLFAGSGALGIEALSRGADSAVFVENAAAALKIIEKNLDNTRLGANAEIIRGDFKDFLVRTDKTFDIVFLDPPYKSGFYETALRLLAEREILAGGGFAIAEHEYDIAVSSVAGYKIYTDRRYGKSCVAVMEKE